MANNVNSADDVISKCLLSKSTLIVEFDHYLVQQKILVNRLCVVKTPMYVLAKIYMAYFELHCAEMIALIITISDHIILSSKKDFTKV